MLARNQVWWIAPTLLTQLLGRRPKNPDCFLLSVTKTAHDEPFLYCDKLIIKSLSPYRPT